MDPTTEKFIERFISKEKLGQIELGHFFSELKEQAKINESAVEIKKALDQNDFLPLTMPKGDTIQLQLQSTPWYKDSLPLETELPTDTIDEEIIIHPNVPKGPEIVKKNNNNNYFLLGFLFFTSLILGWFLKGIFQSSPDKKTNKFHVEISKNKAKEIINNYHNIINEEAITPDKDLDTVSLILKKYPELRGDLRAVYTNKIDSMPNVGDNLNEWAFEIKKIVQKIDSIKK